MDRNELSERTYPVLVRGGGLNRKAALIGTLISAVTLLVALVVETAPSGGSAYLGPLLAKSGHHGKHKHHNSDSDSSDDPSSGVHSQSLSTDGDTQHNSGCTKVIHSLGDLDSAMDGDSSNGAICVQMNNQSVNNTTGWVDDGDSYDGGDFFDDGD
jgi:hypothetical protein